MHVMVAIGLCSAACYWHVQHRLSGKTTLRARPVRHIMTKVESLTLKARSHRPSYHGIQQTVLRH